MKNLLIVFTFTVLLCSCKQKTTTTSQAAIGTNVGSCIIGKWSDSSLPLSLKMSTEFDGDYTNANLVNGLNPIEQMGKVWNDALISKPLFQIPFTSTAINGYASTSSFRDGEIGIYKSYNWFTNVSSNALAITQFYGVVTSSANLGQYVQLTHADIIINYRDYGANMTMTNNPVVEYDVPTIILHEMGHLLGLCHETTKPSIMAPYYLTTQHAIQQYDKEIINYIYVGSNTQALRPNTNINALSSPIGTEVKGIIELHADGKCIHYINGKKNYEHIVDRFKKKK